MFKNIFYKIHYEIFEKISSLEGRGGGKHNSIVVHSTLRAPIEWQPAIRIVGQNNITAGRRVSRITYLKID